MEWPFGARAMSRAEKGNGAEKCIACSDLEARHQTAITIMATTDAQVMSQANLSLPLPAAAKGAVPAEEPPLSAIHFSSLARSLALCQRSSPDFARHFLMA